MRREREDYKAKLREVSEKRHKEYWEAIKSPVMKELKSKIKKIAEGFNEAGKSLRVLIYGESGAGKDYIADSFYHYLKPRGRIEKYDVGPITADHAQADLLGVAPGGWSNIDPRPGVFENCNDGLVFLDEIQNLSPVPQASLLTVINDSMVRRSGGTKLIPVTFHLVVGTNVNLEEKIKEGAFREDLHYRIAETNLTVPPLRERKQDIEPLARKFFSSWVTDGKVEIDDSVIENLEKYDYRKGNIRTLKSIVGNTYIFAENKKHITLSSLKLPKQNDSKSMTDFTEGIEKNNIFEFYEKLKALNIQNKLESQRFFTRWVRYHLEHDPKQTLIDLESLKDGNNEYKLSFLKLRPVFRRGPGEIQKVVDKFDWEVKAPSTVDDTEERKKLDAHMDRKNITSVLQKMPVEDLISRVTDLICGSKISLSDFDHMGFVTDAYFDFSGVLGESYLRYEAYARELKHLIRNVGIKTQDNVGGYYYLESSNSLSPQLERLRDNIQETGNIFMMEVEKHKKLLLSCAEEEFDPRVQKHMNGPLTDEFVVFLLQLKDKLNATDYSFGIRLEVISGSYLANVIRYQKNGKIIMTSMAYRLKLAAMNLGRKLGIYF